MGEPLDALADTERLIIRQHVEYLEAAANAAANALGVGALGALGEMANRYDVFTDDGGKKFEGCSWGVFVLSPPH